MPSAVTLYTVSSSAKANVPAFRAIRPETGGFWFNWQVAVDFRNSIPHPTAPGSPMTYVVDLDGVHPTVEVLQESLLPWAQAVKRGEFGRSSIVVSTRNESVRNYVQSIAAQYLLPIFVSASTSPFQVIEAETALPLSPTDDETLSAVGSLGGSADAGQLASHLQLQHTAATNRLVALFNKGYLHRQKRPGRSGDLFIDPRRPSQEYSTAAFAGQLRETISAPDSKRAATLLQKAQDKPGSVRTSY